MAAPRFHANEVPTDVSLVRRLIAAQFPHWSALPISPARTTGSDHALYRLGDELLVRLPRKEGVDRQIDRERTWLPGLGPNLPCAIPVPLAKGEPGEDYPFFWSVYRWLDGENPATEELAASEPLARDLARFVAALQRIDPESGPAWGPRNFLRGGPLALRDRETRAAIAGLEGQVDSGAATAAWEEALRAEPWDGPPVWLHGDLTPENLLVQGSRLAAVIDFGCLGVGDPACDLMVAWAMLSAPARKLFRSELDVDDATWARGCGWALSTGLGALAYYQETLPSRAENARYRIGEALSSA